MDDETKVVIDNRTAIQTEELIHLLKIKADYEVIIRLINTYESWNADDLGKLLMKLYKVERKDTEDDE